VRQIQSKAMRKLRRPHVARRLKGWLVWFYVLRVACPSGSAIWCFSDIW
jgi:hypothetical protein